MTLWNKLLKFGLVALIALAVAACGSDDNGNADDGADTAADDGADTAADDGVDTAADDGADTAADDGADTAADDGADGKGDDGFHAGIFQLYTLEVDDKCLDGGLDLLFQPDGPGTEYALANTTEFPGSEDLPAKLTIKLQEPFGDMDVTVEADGDNMKIVGASQTGVYIDEAQYADCTADMVINADITILDGDNITVAANLEISNWQGDTCPTSQGDPCTVTLTMRGERRN
jgi:hypothetical protein